MNQSVSSPRWVETSPSLCLFISERHEPHLDGFGKQLPVILGKIQKNPEGWLGIANISQSMEVLILTRLVKDVAKNDVENFLLEKGLLIRNQAETEVQHA